MRITNITKKYKNKNLFTITMKSKTKTTLFTIGYNKSDLQKNYIKISIQTNCNNKMPC